MFVYFDLDDTLCGYWDASKAALRQTFSELGPASVTAEEMVQHWAAAYREFAPLVKSDEWYPQYLVSGRATRVEHMRRVLDRMGIADPTLADQLSDRYAELRNSNLTLFPDALTVLESVAAQAGLGLITNGPADIQRQEVETLGIGSFFSHVFIEGEMGEGKPKLSVFKRAEEAANASAADIWMVGNSFGHDIAPAIEAGWKTCWIRRTSDVPPSASSDAKPEERPAGAPEPTITVGSLTEFLDHLSG